MSKYEAIVQTKCGIFCEQQAVMNGSSFYATPDGGEVEVTEVSDESGVPSCGWPDKMDVGEVTHFLRFGRRVRKKGVKKTDERGRGWKKK